MDVAECVVTNVVAPTSRLEGLWDAVVSPPRLKERLLGWSLLGLTLRSQVSFEESALHGLVVLHGPPGTGKTTLARGLAQQLAPLTGAGQTRLLEVSPHGLMRGEHGASQRRVTELLTEHIPGLCTDGLPTVVLLDEVESLAVARSAASLEANPADVHRATDAVLTALDVNTVEHPHILFVATSNFTGAIDEAFLSRADVSIAVPAPDAAAATVILARTLQAMSGPYPTLGAVAADPALTRVGHVLAGVDGRTIRKVVTEAMAADLETVRDPGRLSLDALDATARSAVAAARSGRPAPRGDRDAAA